MSIALNANDDKSTLVDEQQLRVDLAAGFRLAAKFGWHESVANHFSAAVSADGQTFLMNPRWKHFSKIRASDLLLLDARDKETMSRANAPDPSAWCIHSAIHAAVPQARILLHAHPRFSTALAGLEDPSIKPIDQNTARYFNRMAIDLGFGGIADDEAEGKRLAAAFGNHSVMMMGNHGVAVAAPTVAEAFEELYYLERAAETMILAYSSGQELNIMSDELAEKTSAGWDDYKGMAFAHFEQQKEMLDAEDPSYKD